MTTHRTRAPGRHRAVAPTHRPTTAPPASRMAHRTPTARAATTAAVTAAVAATMGAPFAGPAVAAPSLTDPSEQTSDSISSTTDETPAARAARAEPRVAGTPCSASARACVDLESQRAWLIEDGEVTRGPMRISSGAQGEETPVGHSFRVYRQDIDHTSGESTTRDGRPAPMPYSTFFADGGVAFHAGDPARASAGCIRMETDDAEVLFGELEQGDKVQVVNASEERAARAART